MPSQSEAQRKFHMARLARELKAGKITKAQYDRKVKEFSVIEKERK